jgi:hypothetical protein
MGLIDISAARWSMLMKTLAAQSGYESRWVWAPAPSNTLFLQSKCSTSRKRRGMGDFCRMPRRVDQLRFRQAPRPYLLSFSPKPVSTLLYLLYALYPNLINALNRCRSRASSAGPCVGRNQV